VGLFAKQSARACDDRAWWHDGEGTDAYPGCGYRPRWRWHPELGGSGLYLMVFECVLPDPLMLDQPNVHLHLRGPSRTSILCFFTRRSMKTGCCYEVWLRILPHV
jgi:hypothetical protein